MDQIAIARYFIALSNTATPLHLFPAYLFANSLLAILRNNDSLVAQYYAIVGICPNASASRPLPISPPPLPFLSCCHVIVSSRIHCASDIVGSE